MSMEHFISFLSADSQQRTKPCEVKGFKNTTGEKGTFTLTLPKEEFSS